MYDGDSFYTLSMVGRAGLVLLSGLLAVALVWLFVKTTKQINLVLKLIFAVIFLWFFVWLSPQVYYTYYVFIFDTLEFQNVIKRPPMPNEVLSLLSFSDRANFSNHSKGILGWILIVISLKSSYFSASGPK